MRVPLVVEKGFKVENTTVVKDELTFIRGLFKDLQNQTRMTQNG